MNQQTIKPYTPQPSRRSGEGGDHQRAVRSLLSSLCIEWGICIAPDCVDKLVAQESLTAKQFANKVLMADVGYCEAYWVERLERLYQDTIKTHRRR